MARSSFLLTAAVAAAFGLSAALPAQFPSAGGGFAGSLGSALGSMGAPPGQPMLVGSPMAGGDVPPSGGCGPGPMMGPEPPPPPPETSGVQLRGKDLKKAVGQVRSLHWHKRLADAQRESTATGKPILWLQSLGDIAGFA